LRLAVLTPPGWGISRSLARWSRRLKIPLGGSQPIESAITVGDGSPDDIVCLVLCHKFDGRKVVGINKPQEGRGASSISAALQLTEGVRVKNLMVVLDQEGDKLEEIFGRAEGKLHESGVKFEIGVEEGRLRTYNCIHAHRKFRTLVVVNGLDKPYSIHTIEDHLLEFSERVLEENVGEVLDASNKNPKEVWEKLKDKHEGVYSHLLKAEEKDLEQIFPQHIRALGLLQEP